ncbi:hypothetical protein TWF970_010612 [Orbilia oligospora]|uniref:Beta-xylanase n=1 Tax=Orbilia oligospora TaxID=2813651 RepID=A0A7C8RDM4_ORBOL|nr:hypothetical protein TWF970_010612 [Orbilia oligospora]
MFHWDVVNEAFNEDGTFRDSIFYQILGESYIEIALRAAAAADPAAKLYINDYNVEGVNAKSTALLNLFKRLKAAGVPVHGLGLQGHLISGQVPTDIEANLNRMAAAGAEIAITELDIRMNVPPANQTAADAQLAKDYETVTKACKVTGRCVGITVWNFTDVSFINIDSAHIILSHELTSGPSFVEKLMGPISLCRSRRCSSVGQEFPEKASVLCDCSYS